MKKIFAALLAAFCMLAAGAEAQGQNESTKEAGDPEKVLVYGIVSGGIDVIQFVQTDTRLEPSILNKSVYPKLNFAYYYGEAVPGGNYVCMKSVTGFAKTTYYGIGGLSSASPFNFVAPKQKGRVVFLGFLFPDGRSLADTKLFTDKQKEKWEGAFEKSIPTLQADVLKSLLKRYEGTAFEAELRSEYEKADKAAKEFKKGGKK